MKAHTWIGQSRWMERCLAHAQIQSEDWFRLAQNRTEWRKRIQQAFPDRTLSPQEHSRLDSWRRGTPLPDNSPPAPNLVPVHVDTPGRYGCWVCRMSFEHGNARQVHYENCHAICNPAVTTTPAFQCTHCLVWFPKLDLQRHHESPARDPLERLAHVFREGDPPLESVGEGQAPVFRHIYTDGSGAHGKAGWAAVVYDAPPARPVTPDFVLFGPVLIAPWDPNFLGAERLSNNTGELSAIAETCLWLLERKDEPDAAGNVAGAEIHYDSEYARDIAVRVAQPKSNIALAQKVADLVDEVRVTRPLEFWHVKGHSGDYWNDAADKYADLGAAGNCTPQWARWAEVPVGWEDIQGRDPRLIEVCGHYGMRFYDRYARGSELQARSVKSHEERCRGDADTNYTCRHCGTNILDLRLLRVRKGS